MDKTVKTPNNMHIAHTAESKTPRRSQKIYSCYFSRFLMKGAIIINLGIFLIIALSLLKLMSKIKT